MKIKIQNILLFKESTMTNFSEILNIAIDAAKNPTITDDQFKKICDAIDDKLTNAWFNNHIDMDTHFDLICKLNEIKDKRLNRDFYSHSSSRSNNNFLLQQMQEQQMQQIHQQYVQMQMNQQMQMFM